MLFMFLEWRFFALKFLCYISLFLSIPLTCHKFWIWFSSLWYLLKTLLLSIMLLMTFWFFTFNFCNAIFRKKQCSIFIFSCWMLMEIYASFSIFSLFFLFIFLMKFILEVALHELLLSTWIKHYPQFLIHIFLFFKSIYRFLPHCLKHLVWQFDLFISRCISFIFMWLTVFG